MSEKEFMHYFGDATLVLVGAWKAWTTVWDWYKKNFKKKRNGTNI